VRFFSRFAPFRMTKTKGSGLWLTAMTNRAAIARHTTFVVRPFRVVRTRLKPRTTFLNIFVIARHKVPQQSHDIYNSPSSSAGRFSGWSQITGWINGCPLASIASCPSWDNRSATNSTASSLFSVSLRMVMP